MIKCIKKLLCSCRRAETLGEFTKNPHYIYCFSDRPGSFLDGYHCECRLCGRKQNFRANYSLSIWANLYDSLKPQLKNLTLIEEHTYLKKIFTQKNYKSDSVYITDLETEDGETILDGFSIIKGQFIEKQTWQNSFMPSHGTPGYKHTGKPYREEK